jgi:hypothetical protein
MFKSLAIKALIGTGAIAGVAASAGAVAINPDLAAAATPAAQGSTTTPRADKDVRQGVIVSLNETSMTIERKVRDKTTRTATKDDVKFVIASNTKVYKAGSKTAVGHDALKLGERVRVRFAEKDGVKTATRVVILRDLRAGTVIAKGNDYIVIHTLEHGDVKVVVTDKTLYFTGHGKTREKGTFAAIKVGDRVVTTGEEDSAHNFDAVRVHYASKPAPRDRARTTAPGAAAPTTTPAQ